MHKFFILLVCFWMGTAQSKDLPTGRVVEHKPLAPGYRICVLGDTGQGILDQYRVSHLIAQLDCQAIRHTGDIIYPDGLESADDPQFFTKFYSPYRELLENHNIQFFMSLGNHDYKENPAAWYSLAQRYKLIHFPSFYYADVFEDICFVTLDSMDYVNSKQTKWVKRFKREYKERCRVTLAFAHHPYRSAGKSGDASGGWKKFLESTVIGSFDAYFAGHDHILNDEGVHKGTRLFVSGAGSKFRTLKRKPRVWGKSQLGLMVLEFARTRKGKHHIEFTFYGTDRSGEKELLHKGTIKAKGIRY